jgi:hypothetical protein
MKVRKKLSIKTKILGLGILRLHQVNFLSTPRKSLRRTQALINLLTIYQLLANNFKFNLGAVPVTEIDRSFVST